MILRLPIYPPTLSQKPGWFLFQQYIDYSCAFIGTYNREKQILNTILQSQFKLFKTDKLKKLLWITKMFFCKNCIVFDQTNLNFVAHNGENWEGNIF